MRHKITIDDLIYLYEEPQVLLSYSHRNPRAKSFFEGISKKKCRALIIDTQTENVIDSMAFPTKDRVSKLIEELGPYRMVRVTLPSFNSMFRWLFNHKKFVLPKFNDGNLYCIKTKFKTKSTPYVLVDIGESRKYPESIKKFCNIRSKDDNMYLTNVQNMELYQRNHIELFDPTNNNQVYEPQDIHTIMNIIKLVYAGEDRTVKLYSEHSPENSDRSDLAKLFKFLKNMPIEFHR
jgi:hypothetical protein